MRVVPRDPTAAEAMGTVSTVVPHVPILLQCLAAPTPLAARWKVQFEKDDVPSVGLFQVAEDGTATGSFLTTLGDYRYLAGHFDGEKLVLQTYDGAHLFYFSAAFTDDQWTDGHFYSGNHYHTTWSAAPAEPWDSSVALAQLNPPADSLFVRLVDAEGKTYNRTLVPTEGRVTVLDVLGTWCPNCNDEARFMAPFHQQYRENGLEVVSLMFEHFDDAAIAAEQVRLFRTKHGIEYDTLIAGISDKTEAGKALPSLSAVLAFPTTIFIDRGGRVREIHTGFTGPGTGEHYVRLQEEFHDLVSGLLAEPPDLIESIVTDNP